MSWRRSLLGLLPGAKLARASDTGEVLKHLSVARRSSADAFNIALLNMLIENGAMTKPQAAAICRFAADAIRDDRAVMPKIAEQEAERWDEIAISFEPREPGPLPPGSNPVPRWPRA